MTVKKKLPALQIIWRTKRKSEVYWRNKIFNEEILVLGPHKEGYSEHSQTSKTELFMNIVNG